MPGLSFSAATRVLAGTPTAASTHNMTYTARDADGYTARLSFVVVVNRAPTTTGTADDYTPLENWTVSHGRVQFFFFSAGQCVNLSNTTLNGVTYTIHSSKWQSRADASSAWTDISGTERTGGVCSYSPTEPGQYRGVAEISIGGTRKKYSTTNILTVG